MIEPHHEADDEENQTNGHEELFAVITGHVVFMVDVIRRSRLDLRHGCELFSGRRADVLRLRDRLQELTPE